MREPLVQPVSPTPRKKKIDLIQNHLIDMDKRKDAFYRKFRRYRRIARWTDTAILAVSTVCTTSLFIQFIGNTNIMFVSAILSSLATVGSAVTRVCNWSGRWISAQTSWLQYTDLSRDVRNRLNRSPTSEELDVLLNEINSRLGLIEDQALPLSSFSE